MVLTGHAWHLYTVKLSNSACACSGLAYKHGRTAQDRASLPISLALGAGGGLAGALISGSTVFWRTALQRAGAFVLSCQALMFLG